MSNGTVCPRHGTVLYGRECPACAQADPVTMKDARVVQSAQSRHCELIVGFTNHRFEAVKLSKGHTPEQIAQRLERLANRIRMIDSYEEG